MICIGDKVCIRGFGPMSSMCHYEGAHGVVTDIEIGRPMGDVMFVQLSNGDKIIPVRRQFCEKE